jgi:hypothetical protein
MIGSTTKRPSQSVALGAEEEMRAVPLLRGDSPSFFIDLDDQTLTLADGTEVPLSQVRLIGSPVGWQALPAAIRGLIDILTDDIAPADAHRQRRQRRLKMALRQVSPYK